MRLVFQEGKTPYALDTNSYLSLSEENPHKCLILYSNSDSVLFMGRMRVFEYLYNEIITEEYRKDFEEIINAK